MSGVGKPTLGGVCTVLITPFSDDGDVDLVSLRQLVEHDISWGIDALVCFGLASESYKLDDDERRAVLKCVLETVDGRVPVVAGVDHPGVESAAARAREATAQGVAAVMSYPPTFVRPDRDGVIEFYACLAKAAAGVPVIVQDAPLWTGVQLPVDLLAGIKEKASNVCCVKVEAPPTTAKVAALARYGLRSFGGYGAMHLAEEIRAGIVGTMPGPVLPGLYSDLWRLAKKRFDGEFWALYTRALPLLAFQMSSLDLFVSVQKTLLARNRVIASARMRRPSTPATAQQIGWLDEVLTRAGLTNYLSATPS